MGSGSDVLQARASQAKAQLAAERAQGEQRKAHATLGFLMGLPPATPLPLPALLDAPADATVAELDQWLSEARARHPQIAAAQAQVGAAEARAEATRKEGLATVDFTYAYYANGYPNQGLSALGTRVTNVGVALSIPLFEGFSRQYRVRGAQAQVEQNRANLQWVQQQVALEVLKAHAEASAALHTASFASQLLSAAEAAAQSAQRRHDKGAADIMELLSAQNALAEARLEQVRGLVEWHARAAEAAGGLGAV